MRFFCICVAVCLVSVLVADWLKGNTTDFSWSEGAISVSLAASATAGLLQAVGLLKARG